MSLLSENDEFIEIDYMSEMWVLNNVTNKEIEIPHFGDFFWFVNIQIDKKYGIYPLKYFIVKCGNTTIWNIPFDILINLSTLHFDNKYYYIKIPHNIFFKNNNNDNYLPLHFFKFSILVQSDITIDYKMNMLYVYAKPNFLSKCFREPLNMIINQYYNKKFDNQILSIEKNIKYCPGFFVKTTRLDNLTIFSVSSCGNQKLQVVKYDKYLLNTFIIKEQLNKKKIKKITKILQYTLSVDIINIILDYVEKTYLYYVPSDLINGSWDDPFVKNYLDSNKHEFQIDFNKCHNGDITFVSYNKLKF